MLDLTTQNRRVPHEPENHDLRVEPRVICVLHIKMVEGDMSTWVYLTTNATDVNRRLSDAIFQMTIKQNTGASTTPYQKVKC